MKCTNQHETADVRISYKMQTQPTINIFRGYTVKVYTLTENQK